MFIFEFKLRFRVLTNLLVKINNLTKETPSCSTEKQELSLPCNEKMSSFFDTEYMMTGLKGRAVRGGAITMAAQGAKFFFRIGSTVILARLLTHLSS